MFDPIDYYQPETRLFSTLSRGFADTGQLSPEALYLIIDWKAPRARTKHLKRLAGLADGSFDVAAQRIADDLQQAARPEQRLEVLMTKWDFKLATASAILAVLYPDMFTVYDIRVCETLRECGDPSGFGDLKDKMWSAETWHEYLRFIDAVRKTAPTGLTLRECDQWCWGKNKQKTLSKNLEDWRRQSG